jgi:hypothetical protein
VDPYREPVRTQELENAAMRKLLLMDSSRVLECSSS